MKSLPLDTKALRQMIFFGLAAFGAGFGTTFFLLYLLATFSVRSETWKVLHVLFNITSISILAGLSIAAATVYLFSRRNYRRGIYRCPYCNKPLKSLGLLCGCPQAQALITGRTELQ